MFFMYHSSSYLDGTSFWFSFLSFTFTIHSETGAFFFFFFFMFFLFFIFSEFWGCWLSHSTAVYHRSKFDLKYYNLAVSGWPQLASPCQHVGTSSCKSILWQLTLALTERIQWLVRDFTTNVGLQACAFTVLCFDLASEVSLEYGSFLLYCFEIWAKQANFNVTDEKNYVRYSFKKSNNLSVRVYVNTFKKGLSNV